MESHSFVKCYTLEGKEIPCPDDLPPYDEMLAASRAPRLVPSTAADHEKEGPISGCCDSALNPPTASA